SRPSQPGRPTTALRTLVEKMSTANPLWGAPRIQVEALYCAAPARAVSVRAACLAVAERARSSSARDARLGRDGAIKVVPRALKSDAERPRKPGGFRMPAGPDRITRIAVMNIDIAIVPVAGLGTRLLPATKSQPKEMLPVGRKPVVQYVVEELTRV